MVAILKALFWGWAILASWCGVFSVLGWILYSFVEAIENLCTGKNGRARASIDLMLSAAMLVTPWLLLMEAQALGYIRSRPDAWWPVGLMLGAPFWAMLKGFSRFLSELMRLRSHPHRGDRLDAKGWGKGLARAGFYLAVTIGSAFYLWTAWGLAELIIWHPEHLR
jgi:hypothetical protein